jgi:hypothetical protein
VKNTIDLAANTVTTIAGAAGAGAGGDGGMLTASATMALGSAMAIYDFMRRYFIKADSYRPPMAEVYDPTDIPETVKLVLNLITSIANTVVPMIYDFTMARVDIPAKNKRTGRDSIIAALTVWTQSLHMASAWKFWTMYSIKGNIHEAVLWMNGNAEMTLDAREISTFATTLTTGESALASLTQKEIDDTTRPARHTESKDTKPPPAAPATPAPPAAPAPAPTPAPTPTPTPTPAPTPAPTPTPTPNRR